MAPREPPQKTNTPGACPTLPGFLVAPGVFEAGVPFRVEPGVFPALSEVEGRPRVELLRDGTEPLEPLACRIRERSAQQDDAPVAFDGAVAILDDFPGIDRAWADPPQAA